MDRKLILRNLILSTLQAALSAVILFILYRYIIQLAGIEQFGVFSILTASVYFLGIGALGLPSAIQRCQAKYLALGDEEQAVKVLQTGVTSLALIMLVVVSIAFPIYRTLLPNLFPQKNLYLAYSLLPASLIYIWFEAIRRSAVQSLDACFRVDIRAVLMIIQPLIIFMVSLVLIPQIGILGYVFARIAAAGFVIIAGWFSVKRILPKLPMFPIYWRLEYFKELMGYGLQMQLSGLSLSLFEPLTKVFLGLYGDLTLAGYYEVAQKLVFQVRGLLITSSQSLISLYTRFQEQDSKRLLKTYLANINTLLFMAIPAFVGLVSVSPFFAELMLDHHKQNFIIIMILLSFSYLLNSISAPSYFVYSGIGELKWNIISRLSMVIFNIVLGISFGSLFGGMGVIAAVALSYGLMPLITLYTFQRRNKITLQQIFFKANSFYLIGCALVSAAALFCFFNLDLLGSKLLAILIFFLIIIALYLILIWLHPQRKKVLDVLMISKNTPENLRSKSKLGDSE